MFLLKKRVEFCAAHRLHSPTLSERENQQLYRKCNSPNYHGHNYVLEVAVSGEPDPNTGMVIDFGRLEEIIDEQIITKVDHKNLNIDVDFLHNTVPTAENLARKFWQILEPLINKGNVRLFSITVSERQANTAVYYGPGKEVKGI